MHDESFKKSIWRERNSKVSKDSSYVNYECAFAMGAGAHVVPILREGVPLHPRLEGVQYIDFTLPGKRWLRLLDALKRTLRGQGPQIRAAFELENAKPRRIGRGFVVLLSIDRLPPRSRIARFEVHDKSFKKSIWRERNPEENFDTWMSSYGDFPISARIQTGSIKKPEKEVRTYTTLFDALRSTHANSRNSAVRKALKIHRRALMIDVRVPDDDQAPSPSRLSCRCSRS